MTSGSTVGGAADEDEGSEEEAACACSCCPSSLMSKPSAIFMRVNTLEA